MSQWSHPSSQGVEKFQGLRGGDLSCGEEGVKGLGSGEPGVSEDLWASTGWIRLEAAAAHPRPSKLNVAFVGVDCRKPPCPAHFLAALFLVAPVSGSRTLPPTSGLG